MQSDIGHLGLVTSTFCIVVDEDLEELGSFYSKVFGATKISINSKPLRHGTIQFLSPNGEILSCLLLIRRKDIPVPLLDTIESFSVRQIFVFVKDLVSVQALATQCGAQVTESNIDYENPAQSKNSCTLEGPGRIIINVNNYSTSKTLKFHEVIMNTIQCRLPGTDASNDILISSENRQPISPAEQETLVISKPPRNNSPNRVYFPSLKVDILSKGAFIPCPANPKYPIPFETDLFKGCALLAVRTNPVDPMYNNFFTGKRLFECQIQGKFKRPPQGEYFVGTESILEMKLGLIPRSIAKAVLQFFGSSISGLQHSFGDSQSNPDFQYPHLVAGMFSSLDKVVVTPPGQMPPPLGSPFPEDPDYRKLRQKYKTVAEANVDLESTYSFSVNSSNMDLLNWAMCGIPLNRPIDMRPFLGDSCIRLVGYELPKELADKNANAHPQRSLNYLFNIRLTHIDSNEPIDLEFDDNDDEFIEEYTDETRAEVDINSEAIQNLELDSTELSDQIRRGSRRVLEDEDDGVEDDDDDSESDSDGDEQPGNEWRNSSVDNKDAIPKAGKKGFFREKTVGGAVRNWFRRANPVPLHEIPESAEFAIHDHAFETFGDLKYCPASIEISDNRGERGRRRVMYILPWNEDLQVNSSNHVPRIRSYAEISKLLAMSPIPRLHKNKKFSEEEKRRRQIMESYKVYLSKVAPANNSKGSTIPLPSPLVTLLGQQTAIDQNFLMKPPEVLRIGSVNSKNEHWEGCVATARASRHWIEKYIMLSKTEVVLMKNSGRKRNPMTIPLVSVISVSPLSNDESPFPSLNFALFQIETAARVHYFMVRSERLLKDWLLAFQQVLGNRIVKMEYTDDASTRNQYNLSSSDVEDAYIGKPCDWKLDKRRIFNYRRIFFNPNGIPDRIKKLSSTKLVEGILMKAFLLSEITEKTRASDPRLWIDFSDEISALQLIDFSLLQERERIAFFLNVYHIMVLHGIIVLGPPLAWVNWQSFFNSVTYIIDSDIISIAELEQNIVRAAMSKSSMLFSKTIAPQSSFPIFSLKQRDFRLNFCVNNGSASMASCVPIYRAETLDRQLDEMTSLMLSETVVIDNRKRVVILPKICSAYLQDFSTNSKSSRYVSDVSPLDCVRVLAPYLNNSDRRSVVKLLSDTHSPSVKFKNFNFTCRRFELYQQSLAEED